MNPPSSGANEDFSQEPQFPAYTYCIIMVESVFLRLSQLMKKEKVFEMKLTPKEKKMLDGYQGPARQKAMELTGMCLGMPLAESCLRTQYPFHRVI